MFKTNVMRIADVAGISYEHREYAYDENDLSGIHAAKELGIEPERMFKTLVTRGDRNGINVFCIPVSQELDLKKCAISSGNKRVEMVHVKELQGLTGYVRGGCSPIGMKKQYPTFIDETAILFESICVSAGQRGHQISLSPDNLVSLCSGSFADLTK